MSKHKNLECLGEVVLDSINSFVLFNLNTEFTQ